MSGEPSDAAIAAAVRKAVQHYVGLGRDPMHCDVSLGLVYEKALATPQPAPAPEPEPSYVGSVRHWSNNAEGGLPPPAYAPDQIIVLSRGFAPELDWYLVAERSTRPDIQGKPVYETLDKITGVLPAPNDLKGESK